MTLNPPAKTADALSGTESNRHEVADLIRRKQGQAVRQHRDGGSGSLTQLSDETDIRHTVEFDEAGRHMSVGSNIWDLAGVATAQELLNEYLAFVYSLRGVKPGTPVHVHRPDLEVLESEIDWPTDRIAAYLVDLMLAQSSTRRVQPTSKVKEKTRDTMEDLVDWWNGKPGT